MSKPTVRVDTDCPDREAYCQWLSEQGYEPTKGPGQTVDSEIGKRLWERFCNQPAHDADALTGQGRC